MTKTERQLLTGLSEAVCLLLENNKGSLAQAVRKGVGRLRELVDEETQVEARCEEQTEGRGR